MRILPSKLLHVLFTLTVIGFLSPGRVFADDADLKAQVSKLQAEVQALRVENSTLKKENQALRQELSAARKANTVVPQNPSAQPTAQPQTEPKATGYWITTASGIRHNSSCRYYMNSKGRVSGPNEGRACKLCGG